MPAPAGKKKPSSAVVPTGPKEIFSDATRRPRRTESGQKPTTERALVLRNGKYGAQGAGEVMLLNKMSGREKLDLLAEDLMQKSTQALGVKLDLDKCLRIAESMFYANLDDINDLQDPDLFIHKVKAEVQARKPKDSSAFKNATAVAEIIAAKIHNAYMLASGWKIVFSYLRDLRASGVQDNTLRSQLAANEQLRTKYLVLFDVVNVLTEASQAKFALLATTTPHYSHYFKKSESDELDAPEYVFDWHQLKDVHKSFIDSIIVELCLPRSHIPKNILYLILRDAVDEAPREAKKLFPQTLWDAVGDLSMTVQLQEMLESVLLGPEAEKWKQEIGHLTLPEEYDNWLDAQTMPSSMVGYVANWKDIIYPLDKTKQAATLDNMWRFINLNYESFTGKDIDTFWRLEEVHQRTPQWHAFKVDAKDINLDTDEPPSLTPFKSKNKGANGKPRLAITNGDGDESDDSMPSLQTVSDSSEAETNYDDSEVGSESDEYETESESEYDEEDEDVIREMFREAMDAATAIPEFLDPKIASKEFDELAEERKGNPFIKLLGSLRGRMFSSDPTLRTSKRSQPSRPFPGGALPSAGPAGKPVPKRSPAPAQPKPQKATVEEVEDEEEGGIPSATKKKKKKKPKKKKKKSTEATENGEPATPVQPATPTIPSPPSPATPKETSKKETPKPKPARAPSISSSINSINAMPFGGSTASLPQPTVARSGRKYMQEEGIEEKTKAKSKPNYGNLAPIPEKKSFFGKLKKDKKDADDEEKKGSKHSFFTSLTRKTKTYMHQLLNTAEDEKKGLAPMKWENFLKVMREMGFKYDPSTAGSSVRFDPPHPKDPPITFHKPHPDPTLYPVMLKDFSKKLKRYYGWSEEDFYRAAG